MGNCLVLESSIHWTDDDWGSPAPDDEEDHRPFFSAKRRRGNHDVEEVWDYEDDSKMDEKGSFGNNSTSSSRRETSATTEVKIKVTRRQLEKLLGKVDLKELSVEEVLAQLMIIGSGAGSGECGVHEVSWRPALHSIPE